MSRAEAPPVEAGKYLVAVRDLVVAQDIAGTISDRHPGAVVLSAHSLEEAELILNGMDRLSVAVIDAKPVSLYESPMASLLKARGAKILFLSENVGNPPVADARPYRYLSKPFTTAQLVSALSALDPDIRIGED